MICPLQVMKVPLAPVIGYFTHTGQARVAGPLGRGGSHAMAQCLLTEKMIVAPLTRTSPPGRRQILDEFERMDFSPGCLGLTECWSLPQEKHE